MGNLPHNVGVRNSKCGGKKLKDFGKCFYSYKCCVALCCGFKKKLYKYNLCVSTIYNKSKGWGVFSSPSRFESHLCGMLLSMSQYSRNS
jgi:hypothetical protein